MRSGNRRAAKTMRFHSIASSTRVANRIPSDYLLAVCPSHPITISNVSRSRRCRRHPPDAFKMHQRRIVSTTTTTATTATTAAHQLYNENIASIPFRSVLYVPASNTRALEKVTKLFASSSSSSSSSVATKRSMRPDAIMYDLEDGVHPTKKKEARDKLYEYLQQSSAAKTAAATTPTNSNYFGLLRINRSDTPWFQEDASLALAMVLDESINIHGVVLPKIEGWKDIDWVARHFRSLVVSSCGEGDNSTSAKMSSTSTSSSVNDDDDESILSPVPLWAMVETPQAILSASEIARQTSIQGLILGTNDLSKELHLRPSTTTTTTSASLPPRMGLITSLQHAILAARAHDKLVIDGVYNNIASDAENVENFRRECVQGKEWGMDGKTLIHPNQIQVANEIFTPSDAEIRYARRVVACWESAVAGQSRSGQSFTGVAVVDGMMIEQLHVDTARKLLDQAKNIHSM